MNDIEIYKANEILENRYYQVPQELFENSLYRDLDLSSKVLYSFIFLRRHWSDEYIGYMVYAFPYMGDIYA